MLAYGATTPHLSYTPHIHKHITHTHTQSVMMRRLPSRLTHRTDDRAPTPLVLAKDTFQRRKSCVVFSGCQPCQVSCWPSCGSMRSSTAAAADCSAALSFLVRDWARWNGRMHVPLTLLARASVWALVQSQGGKQRWRWARWGAGYKWVCLIRREHRWSVTCIYATLNLPAFGAVLFLFTCK